MHKQFVVIFLFLSACLFANAQVLQEQLKLKVSELPIQYYTPAEGLSQGFCSAIAVDLRGYIWIATKEGLNRFDGREFKIYRHSANDPNSLADNFVTSLCVGDDNKIWIGTNSGVIDCLDVTNEAITHVNLINLNSANPGVQTISSIIPAGKGRIIAGLGMGYKVIEYKQLVTGFIKVEIKNLEKVYPGVTGLKWGYESKNIMTLPNNNLCLQIQNSIYDCSPTGRKIIFSYDTSKFGIVKIVSLFKKRKTIYLAVNNYLYEYNNLKFQFDLVLQLPAPYIFSNSIFIDKEGRVWTALENHEYLRIDIAKKDFDLVRLVAPGYTISNPREEAGLLCGTIDSLGNFWFGTNGWGIMKISPSNLFFKKITEGYTGNFSSRWQLGFSQNGFPSINNPTIIANWLRLLEKSKLYEKGFRKALVDENFALDANGNYWFNVLDVNSTKAYLVKLNAQTGVYDIVFERSSMSGVQGFQPIFSDKQNRIWACEATLSGTVKIYCFDAKTGVKNEYTLPRMQKTSAEYRVITDVVQDETGNIWFASYIGLFKLSPDKKTWTIIEEGKGSISTNKLLSLCIDPAEPAKYLWIGTEGGGLNQLDLTSGKVAEFTTANGLPNNVIYSVQSDLRKNLWLSTNNGISLFYPSTKTVRNFDKSHGLEGLEFNRYQFSKSSYGEIYLGGVGFQIHFNPENFYQQKSSAKIVINGLKIDNEEISLQNELKKKNPLILRAIDFTNELVLNHNQSMVSFQFTLLDVSNPSSNSYRYKLAGLNKEWISNGHKNEAVFTNLEPGDYIFYASGHNGDGHWSNAATITLHILPAWWQTWWFILLIIVLIISVIYFLVKSRISKALQLEKLRNRIAQDLHDDIGSTLSSVGIYSAALSKSIHTNPEKAQNILEKISNSTNNMMESMSDIVWSVNPSNDSIQILIARMRQFAASVTESANVNLHFETNVGESKKVLSMIDRKNIYLIFKESVNNSLKHSKCKNVWIRLWDNGKQMLLEIKDDGKGINTQTNTGNEKELSGNGIINMYARAKESKAELIIKPSEQAGTITQFTLEK